jgi:urease accessory protein
MPMPTERKESLKDCELETWLPWLLQTNDSIFPSGTYAHSFGLEGLVELKIVTDLESLRSFLVHTVTPALMRFELPILHFAYEAALDGKLERLLQLDARFGAMKPAQELRLASSRIGTQRLQMLLQLAPHALLRQLEEKRVAGLFNAHLPVVHGAQTAIVQTPVLAVLISYYYQSLAALVSAAMKLIRLGQIAAQRVLAECLAAAQDIVARALAVEEKDAGWFSPLLDIASAQHEKAYTRIFIS